MPVFFKYYFSISLLTFVVPSTVFADCKVTDTDGHYVVVCSGNDSSENTTSAAAKAKAGRTRKAKRTRFKSQDVIVMNEEEKRIMESNNQLDGYRSKRKFREKAIKKSDTGHLNPVG